MSKRMLIGVIASAVLAVGVIAALTATVIVSDDDGGGRVVQIAPAPVPLPLPGQGLPPLGRERGGRLFGPRFRPLRDLRSCLRQHGLGRPNRSAPPTLQTMRNALKACRGTLRRSP